MASWCLLTGQPVAAYLTLTALQRDTFATIAHDVKTRG